MLETPWGIGTEPGGSYRLGSATGIPYEHHRVTEPYKSQPHVSDGMGARTVDARGGRNSSSQRANGPEDPPARVVRLRLDRGQGARHLMVAIF